MRESSPTRVLLVSADAGDAEALAALLRTAGAVEAGRASAAAEAVEALAPNGADAVVASRGVDGAALVRELRAGGVRLPVLVLADGEEEQDAALAAGAAGVAPREGLTAPRLARGLAQARRGAGLVAELRETRRTLSALLGNLPGMVYRARGDARHGVEFASNRCADLTGYPAEELAEGRVGLLDLVHPEDRDWVRDTVDAAARSGSQYRLMYRIQTARGSEKWVSDEGVALPAEGPGEARLEGFLSDVTEQMRTEAALRESERYVRALIENASEAFAVLTGEGAIRFASPALGRMMGGEAPVRVGSRLLDLVDAGDLPRARAFLDAVMAAPGEVVTRELGVRRADGTVGTLEASARNLLHDPVVRGIVVNARDVTERNEAGRRLEESEQRFKSLFDHNPDAVFSVDLEGRITSVNPAAERLAGVERAELLGQPFDPLVDPANLDEVREHLRRVFLGEPQGFEARVRGAHGRVAELQVTSLPMVVDGEVVGAYGVAKEVTERRAAEQLLRLRDRAIAAVSEGIVITDPHLPDNPIVSVNPAFERLTGYTAAEALGRNCRFLQGPGTDPVAIAELAAAVRDGLPCSVEVLNFRKDGRAFWNFVSIAPVRGGDGRVTHFIGVLNDVTDRRETDEALRSREARFRSLMENAQDIIAVLDGDGTVRFASPAVERVLGYAAGEFAGMYLMEIVEPDDVERVHQVIENAILNPGRPQWAECRVRHRDGTWRVLEVVGTSLLHNPAVMGIVLNARDVSERRRAEEALEQSRQQFLQAQKMEAVGRLAGGVAHDFNNLLTAIRGNADLMLMDLAEGSPAREDVREIRRAADRAADLTRQLLAFSRRQVLQPRVLSLNTIVGEMQRMLSRLLTANVTLQTRLDPSLGSVVADPGQIEQVVVNLAVNARDAMPQGGELTVETANDELDAELARRFPYVVPGRYVRLTVRDTGLGMDRETREQAFEPFFTTKPVGKGTGLGLSTVYGIVKQSGGYVWIDSAPGQGTAVSVHLPRVDEPAGVPEAEADSGQVPRGREMVLVVEDEVTVRNLAGRVLARAGYAVREASDGYEALRIAEDRAAPLDLLLTDVNMPRMGGLELARRVQEMRPGLRVLFFSGDAEAAVAGLDVAGEGVNFIGKPFTAEGLARKVREVLDAPPRQDLK
jgi:two-component system cell cycle sensor histidine kinase/response regulator CckA